MTLEFHKKFSRNHLQMANQINMQVKKCKCHLNLLHCRVENEQLMKVAVRVEPIATHNTHKVS